MDDRVSPVPVDHLLAGAGVRLAHLRLDPRADDAAAALADADDRRRADRSAPGPRDSFLARRAALRAFAADALACPPGAVTWSSARGQRCVVAGDRVRHVSLSVSGPIGLAALAPGPVGVDVEVVGVLPDARDVARAFFTPAEAAWVAGGATPDEGSRRFLRIWVRKEAVVKCTGEGLARDLKSFDVLDAAAGPIDVGRAPGAVHVVDVDFGGHAAAVAVAVPAPAGVATHRSEAAQ